MNEGMLSQLPTMLDSLAESSWAQMPNAIARIDCLGLASDLDLRYETGQFHAARIGQGSDNSEHKTIRYVIGQ